MRKPSLFLSITYEDIPGLQRLSADQELDSTARRLVFNAILDDRSRLAEPGRDETGLVDPVGDEECQDRVGPSLLQHKVALFTTVGIGVTLDRRIKFGILREEDGGLLQLDVTSCGHGRR